MSIAGTLIMDNDLKFYTREQLRMMQAPPLLDNWHYTVLKSGGTRSTITMAPGVTEEQVRRRCRCFA